MIKIKITIKNNEDLMRNRYNSNISLFLDNLKQNISFKMKEIKPIKENKLLGKQMSRPFLK